MDARHETRAKLLNNKDAMNVLSRLGYSARDINDKATWRGAGAHFLAAVTSDSWVRYSVDIQRRYGTRLFLATAFPGEHARFLEALDRHASKLNLDTVSV